MSFWIIATVIAGLVAALLGLAVQRARGSADTRNRDIQVYRDQLVEVDRDLERGVISPDEAERLRLEVSRRVLEADKLASDVTGGGKTRSGFLLASVIAVLTLGGTFLIYGKLGAPNYRDVPLVERLAASTEARANRPSQAEVETKVGVMPPLQEPDPRHLELMDKLRNALKERPGDLQGHILLAQNEAGLGNFVAAHQAQERVIAIKGSDASARDFADYADLLVLAAGGYVSPLAEQVLARTLQLDPDNGTARYYSGLMFAQSDRADLAFKIWRPLYEDSPADAPWIRPIRDQIEIVAADAGVQYTVPEKAELRGPTAEDVNAASEMNDEDRNQMIRGMVAGLSERLASEGGTAEEWAQLIGALGVLGETDRARGIWVEAQTVFGATPDALATVREAAERAGVAE